MAEDIWQNIPYPVVEASVFERGWPTAPQQWRQAISEDESEALRQVRDMVRPLVNRLLESGRAEGRIGSSLEVRVQLQAAAGHASCEAVDLDLLQRVLAASPHALIDNLADWLLVSELTITDVAPPEPLAQLSEAGLMVCIARAEGEKCERCWHYETDIGQHSDHPTLCGRCVAVIA